MTTTHRRSRIGRQRAQARGRSETTAELDVLLTRQGDLAWLSGRCGSAGVVAVKQPGKPTRRLSAESGYRLAVEDGRTLRWYVGDTIYDFFDPRSKPCPSRSRYTPFGHGLTTPVTSVPSSRSRTRVCVWHAATLCQPKAVFAALILRRRTHPRFDFLVRALISERRCEPQSL